MIRLYPDQFKPYRDLDFSPSSPNFNGVRLAFHFVLWVALTRCYRQFLSSRSLLLSPKDLPTLGQPSTSSGDLTAIYLKMLFSSPNWRKSPRVTLPLEVISIIFGAYRLREVQSHLPGTIFHNVALMSMESKNTGSLRHRTKLQSQPATISLLSGSSSGLNLR